MDFHKIVTAVQHSDIEWFLVDQRLLTCLGVFHKKTGDNVMHLACRFGRRDLLENLSLLNEADLQLSNFEGKKPLHEAAQFCQLECVDFLLQNGVQVDCLKRADWTPLMLACTKDQVAVVSLLLQHGANPALVNKDAWNSFHIAAREGHVEILQMLLSVKADLWNTVSLNGRTPLHTAALHGHCAAVDFLLDSCEFTPDTPDSCGVTPLMDALRAGFVDVAKLLIDTHKSDVGTTDHMGFQALHHAAQAGQLSAVDFLLTACCVHPDVASAKSGITPLQVAAKEGQDAVMKVLLQHGAGVNLMDDKGRTALHIASGAQHADSVRLLLSEGALDTEDRTGNLARSLAVHQQVKQAFEEHPS